MGERTKRSKKSMDIRTNPDDDISGRTWWIGAARCNTLCINSRHNTQKYEANSSTGVHFLSKAISSESSGNWTAYSKRKFKNTEKLCGSEADDEWWTITGKSINIHTQYTCTVWHKFSPPQKHNNKTLLIMMMTMMMIMIMILIMITEYTKKLSLAN